MNQNLENIASKLKSVRIRLADEKFRDMAPSELIDYTVKNPDCKIFQDYISNCCSPSRVKEFVKQAEIYEKKSFTST